LTRRGGINLSWYGSEQGDDEVGGARESGCRLKASHRQDTGQIQWPVDNVGEGCDKERPLGEKIADPRSGRPGTRCVRKGKGIGIGKKTIFDDSQ